MKGNYIAYSKYIAFDGSGVSKLKHALCNCPALMATGEFFLKNEKLRS